MGLAPAVRRGTFWCRSSTGEPRVHSADIHRSGQPTFLSIDAEDVESYSPVRSTDRPEQTDRTGGQTGTMTRRDPSRRRLLKRIGTASGVAVGAALAGCTGDDGGGEGNTVEMTDGLRFEPSDRTVSTGTTVTWENAGSVDHTVTAYGAALPSGAAYFASGGFDGEQAARDGFPASGLLGEGETYEHTFETAGTFEYFCIPHESSMTGTITVE